LLNSMQGPFDPSLIKYGPYMYIRQITISLPEKGKRQTLSEKVGVAIGAQSILRYFD